MNLLRASFGTTITLVTELEIIIFFITYNCFLSNHIFERTSFQASELHLMEITHTVGIGKSNLRPIAIGARMEPGDIAHMFDARGEPGFGLPMQWLIHVSWRNILKSRQIINNK